MEYQGSELMTRHARPCAGHPRRHAAVSPDDTPRFISLLLMDGSGFAAWMAGTRPGMTAVGSSRNWHQWRAKSASPPAAEGH
jgi:hypothetical protein